MALIPTKKPAADTAVAEPKVTIPKANPATAAAAQPAAETPAAQPAAAAAAVAVHQPQAGAVTTRVNKPVRDAIKDTFERKMPLEWNTLHRIQGNQGNFLDLEDNKSSFGNEIVVQLLSYQPSWQISPGTDDPADVQWVRYSDDGITTTQGEDCKEFLAALKTANYEKAKMAARYLMAFVIEETPGDRTGRMVGKLVQIDLSATSKAAFDQFKFETSYKESKGMITSEVAEAGRFRMTAKVKSQKNFSWTVVQFEHAL